MSESHSALLSEKGDDATALPFGFSLGKYVVQAVEATSKFGITYNAWDSVLNRAVSIKEYLPTDLATRVDGTIVGVSSDASKQAYATGLRQFVDQARELVRHDSTNSEPQIHDFLETNGTAYVVMAVDVGTAQGEARMWPAPKMTALQPDLTADDDARTRLSRPEPESAATQGNEKTSSVRGIPLLRTIVAILALLIAVYGGYVVWTGFVGNSVETGNEARATFTPLQDSARQQAEDDSRVRAEADAQRRALDEAEASRRAESEARMLAAASADAEREAELRAEFAARLAAEAEARLKAEEEAKRQAEAAERQRAEAEVRARAEAEARIRAEFEAQRESEEDARRKAEEETRRKAEAEARRKAEDEGRQRAEAEARKRLEAEAQAKLVAEGKAGIAKNWGAIRRSAAGYVGAKMPRTNRLSQELHLTRIVSYEILEVTPSTFTLNIAYEVLTRNSSGVMGTTPEILKMPVRFNSNSFSAIDP